MNEKNDFRDSTCFSSIEQQYEEDVAEILTLKDDQRPLGMDMAALESFRKKFAEGAFFCRYPNCGQTRNGFRTATSREEHELAHVLRLQCPKTYCIWAGLGFKDKKALAAHMSRYHPDVSQIMVPDLPHLDGKATFGDFSWFPIDFSGLENSDVLENFEVDSFLQNTDDSGQSFSFDPDVKYSDVSQTIMPDLPHLDDKANSAGGLDFSGLEKADNPGNDNYDLIPSTDLLSQKNSSTLSPPKEIPSIEEAMQLLDQHKSAQGFSLDSESSKRIRESS